MFKSKISFLVLFVMMNCSLSLFAQSTTLFREDSILADEQCDDALNSASSIYMYIGLIKQSYNNICSLNRVDCSKHSATTDKIVEALGNLEASALQFEVDAIKNECRAKKVDNN